MFVVIVAALPANPSRATSLPIEPVDSHVQRPKHFSRDDLSVTLSSAPAARALAVSGSVAPEISAPSSAAIAIGKSVSISAEASDPDVGEALIVTVSGTPSFLSLSESAGGSPGKATLSGVAGTADAGTYELVWNIWDSTGLQGTPQNTTLTVGSAVLDAPQTSGASIVGYATFGDYVVASEGENGISARLGVWSGPWPWAYCQQYVGYPCTFIRNRIVAEIDVQTGARLGFSFEFMQYGTPFLGDVLDMSIVDGGGGVLAHVLEQFGNPVFPNCWGNLWQSPRRDINVDLGQWPNRHVFLEIYVDDCLGHQTDALALIHSIAIRECYETPLAPLSAEDQATYELKPPVESLLTTEMKADLACLRSRVMDAGGSLVVRSAHRTQSYQSHLYELYIKWKKLEGDSTNIDCQDLRTWLKNHIHDHQMDNLQIAPAKDAGLHPQGLAFDANWYDITDATLDALACQCGLYRPFKIADKRHFIQKPCP
jgi:hypothetical protein